MLIPRYVKYPESPYVEAGNGFVSFGKKSFFYSTEINSNLLENIRNP